MDYIFCQLLVKNLDLLKKKPVYYIKNDSLNPNHGSGLDLFYFFYDDRLRKLIDRLIDPNFKILERLPTAVFNHSITKATCIKDRKQLNSKPIEAAKKRLFMEEKTLFTDNNLS